MISSLHFPSPGAISYLWGAERDILASKFDFKDKAGAGCDRSEMRQQVRDVIHAQGQVYDLVAVNKLCCFQSKVPHL